MNNIPYELIARYLAGECNEMEKQEIEKWKNEHPELMAEFSGMWQKIPADDFTPDTEKALQKVNRRIDARSSKGRSRQLFTIMSGVAAAILILIVSIVGIRMWNTPADVSLLALQTNAGETLEYVLADGSKVWLNQSSKLSYPEHFADNVREIYLEGEAFFDVSPDKEKPFIIYANNTQTKVVGTSFGVRAVKGENDVVVTVSTGIINFSAEGKDTFIELKKGEQGVCNPAEQKLVKNTVPDPNVLAWKTKKLVFRYASLHEVAKVIEDAYQIPVTVDQSVENFQINTTFDQLELDDVVRSIELMLPVEAKTTDRGILLTAEK